MSNLFYPAKVSGDKYNLVILEFIPQLRYTVKHEPGQPMATIHEASPPSATPTFKTKIPAAYYLYVQHFLWWYYLLTTLYQKFHNCAMVSRILTTTATRFLQWMQVMLDIVIEQLVMGCVALGENITPDTRIPYFNYYLATEFVVGCHDPTSVDAWRRKPENKDLNLERIHPDTLDWAAYDTALGKHLSGAYYKYSLANVGVRASWIQLLDALRQWYSMTMRVIPKARRKAVAPSTEPTKLVHGMAGLGYQLRKDVDEDRNAEGVIDDDAAEKCPLVITSNCRKQNTMRLHILW
ncbi:hypothetical protein PAXRUDRAFT_21444 [Paxillus rubicundulus Ve08.2h10]|uniref:Uncharacterized protein n=1 Tax=Paxillus rubicundulus Ve08.2h10 TaxID=930991 RepID=A0A0D0D7I8_9AGAM|nr:hypothetical protein PAXRUDRAFT_21444 [Paxillus rubicundulus Ve08.2h10]